MRLRRPLLGLVALGCLALQFGGSLPLSVAALALWLLTMALAARAQLRRLWLPRFWALSLVMALGSGLLLGTPDLTLGPLRLSRVGLEAGVLMVVRGAFLFALMGWASKLIVDDDVQRAIRRVGLAQFGNALSAAFGLIPSLAERVRPALGVGRGSGLVARARLVHLAAVELVCHTARLARSLERQPPLLAAVVGPPGSGKTSLVQRAVARLRSEGFRVGGVTQPAEGAPGARTGYRLRDVSTGEEIAFAQRRGEGGFQFSEVGWGWARQRLVAALTSSDCVVLDELGRLEARGQGHLAGLVLPPSPPVLLVAVREECADAIARHLGPFSLRVHASADAAEGDAFLAALQVHLRQRALPRRATPKEQTA